MADYSDWEIDGVDDEQEAREGFENLIASNVKQASKIRQMEVALSAEKAKVKELQRLKGGAGDALGELGIHKFLDDLSEAGLPSTVYSTFSPTYRTYLLSALTYWAETANRLMGEFISLSSEAITARDAKYADRDKKSEGLFVRGSSDPAEFPGTKEFFDVIADMVEKGDDDH